VRQHNSHAPPVPTGTDAEGNPLSSYGSGAAAAATPPIAPTHNGYGGMNPAMLPMLKMLGPQMGAPLLLQMMTRQNEYDPTPRIGTNPNTGKLDQYLVNKNGTDVRWLGVTPREKMEVSDGKAYNPYTVQSGDVVGQQKPEKPLINGGLMSADNGKTWQPIPGYVAQQSAIASARAQDKPPNPNAPIQLVHPSSGY
jgi:hypothetical protein